MKRVYLINYTYKPAKVTEQDQRGLVKKFLELGTNPGVIAQYERLDGKGGVIIQEVTPDDQLEAAFERTLVYSEYLDFDIVPATPFEDAMPTILKLYG